MIPTTVMTTAAPPTCPLLCVSRITKASSPTMKDASGHTKNVSGSPSTTAARRCTFHTVSVKFLSDGVRAATAELARVRVPIAIIHGSYNIAYPTGECTEELLKSLKYGGLDVSVTSIQGAPHFAKVTHANKYAAAILAALQLREPFFSIQG
ncbi:hypothetical protein DFH09DRAFT_1332636 [Mycena vulgaris]|nr:hypothetical protein DFH09DRAFT_1332636 [Mycena vulgaris]